MADETTEGFGTMGRRATLAAVAVIAILAAAIGWGAGQRIKSPAEIAASQLPPPPSLITVPVEERELSQNVVVRGTVRSSDSLEIDVSAAEGSTIITRLVGKAGDEVSEGDVLIEVAGRPVIALQGDLPVFRNLVPSLEGPDVRQLEDALVRLGYDPGDVDGKYTATTASAVEKLYRDLGYAPVTASEGDEAALKSAEENVTLRQQTLTEARTNLTDAESGLKESERLSLEQGVASAQSQLSSARSGAAEAKAAAAKAVTDAEKAKTDADAEVKRAGDRLAAAKAGTHPDTGQAPTADELAQLEADNTTAIAAQTEAANALAEARAAQPRTTTEQDNLVAAAERDLKLQEALRTEGLAGISTEALKKQVTEAETALSTARGDLADAQARVGAQFPAAELVFVTSFPRQIQQLAVDVGDIPTGAVMTLSGVETVIDSGLSSSDRRLVTLDTEAVIEDDALGLSARARVSFIADNPGGGGLSADRYAMRLEPIDELPEDAINQNLRIVIPINSSGGEVLAVPFAALSAGPDGTARIEVEQAEDEVVTIEVTTGLRAEGFVEIKPIDADLSAGDRVVVGRDLQLPTTATDDDQTDDEDTPAPSDEDTDDTDEDTDEGADT